MDNTNQRKTLQAFAKELQDELRQKVPVKSGKLKRSIKGVATDDTVYIEMLAYGIFNDLGVNGIKKNQGSPFSFRNSAPPSSAFQGAASPFAVSRSIFEKGFRGSLFITNNVDDEIDELATDFADSIWDDFASDLEQE